MVDKNLKKIGKITHFFDHILVGAIKLEDTLKIGDKILIKGRTTNIEQTIESMQINNQKVDVAKKGDEIGLKIKYKVRANDEVFLIK